MPFENPATRLIDPMWTGCDDSPSLGLLKRWETCVTFSDLTSAVRTAHVSKFKTILPLSVLFCTDHFGVLAVWVSESCRHMLSFESVRERTLFDRFE